MLVATIQKSLCRYTSIIPRAFLTRHLSFWFLHLSASMNPLASAVTISSVFLNSLSGTVRTTRTSSFSTLSRVIMLMTNSSDFFSDFFGFFYVPCTIMYRWWVKWYSLSLCGKDPLRFYRLTKHRIITEIAKFLRIPDMTCTCFSLIRTCMQ